MMTASVTTARFDGFRRPLCCLRRTGLALMLGVCATAAPAQHSAVRGPSAGDARPVLGTYALAAVDLDSGPGELVAIGPPPTYTPRRLGIETSGDFISHVRVRSGHGIFVVVDGDRDRLLVLDRAARLRRTIDLPEGSDARDIAILSPTTALLTRRTSPVVEVVDLRTGARAAFSDLSVLADGSPLTSTDDDGNPDPAGLFVQGGLVYVQLQRLNDAFPAGSAPLGGLAVVDLATGDVVDADSSTAGVQAIELSGPHPRLKMKPSLDGQRLFVSATRPFHLDFDGGIDRVNLTTLQSDGLAVAEADLAAISTFAITRNGGGLMLFHTDIVASSHLVPFDAVTGAEFGPEIVFIFGRFVEVMVFDPATGLVLMPETDGTLHLIDPVTETRIGATPSLAPGTVVDFALFETD